MEYLTLARILHIIAVIIWIGGVSMVTTVLIPAIKRFSTKEEKIDTFERIEGRFAIQAKISTLVTAITGFYMVYELDAWYRFGQLQFWWIHAMVIIWLVFSVVLFILEPLFLHRLFRESATKNPERTFRIMHRLHWVLLILSMITTIGAVAGSHGWFFVQ